jgi:hypothetical protein
VVANSMIAFLSRGRRRRMITERQVLAKTEERR